MGPLMLKWRQLELAASVHPLPRPQTGFVVDGRGAITNFALYFESELASQWQWRWRQVRMASCSSPARLLPESCRLGVRAILNGRGSKLNWILETFMACQPVGGGSSGSYNNNNLLTTSMLIWTRDLN